MTAQRFLTRARILFACLAVSVPIHAQTNQATSSPDRLPANQLLVYHNTAGQVLRVTSKSEWQKRRKEILDGMQRIMGPLPKPGKRCALDVRIENEVDCGSYIRRDITYQSEPCSRVPALLLIPKSTLASKRKAPAILALHPTDMDYGRRVVAETLRPHYRAYAADLANRGYVVLAPAYPLMADYQPDLKALGYFSGTMKAIWDNIRGIDLLQSLPYVRKARIGAIGHSLGGHNAIFTSVFDERIRALVSSCGFDSFADYMDGHIDGWTSQRYMPRLLEYRSKLKMIPFDFYELIGALAPRPLFVNAPLKDSNFKWRSVDAIADSARPVYCLYHAEKQLRVVHPDTGHDFAPEVREEAYQFLDRELRD